MLKLYKQCQWNVSLRQEKRIDPVTHNVTLFYHILFKGSCRNHIPKNNKTDNIRRATIAQRFICFAKDILMYAYMCMYEFIWIHISDYKIKKFNQKAVFTCFVRILLMSLDTWTVDCHFAKGYFNNTSNFWVELRSAFVRPCFSNILLYLNN